MNKKTIFKYVFLGLIIGVVWINFQLTFEIFHEDRPFHERIFDSDVSDIYPTQPLWPVIGKIFFFFFSNNAFNYLIAFSVAIYSISLYVARVPVLVFLAILCSTGALETFHFYSRQGCAISIYTLLLALLPFSWSRFFTAIPISIHNSLFIPFLANFQSQIKSRKPNKMDVFIIILLFIGLLFFLFFSKQNLNTTTIVLFCFGVYCAALFLIIKVNVKTIYYLTYSIIVLSIIFMISGGGSRVFYMLAMVSPFYLNRKLTYSLVFFSSLALSVRK
jgi:hypothetical protein